MIVISKRRRWSIATVAASLMASLFLAGCKSKSSEKSESKKSQPMKSQQLPTQKVPQVLKVESDPIAEKIAGRTVTQFILTNKNGVIVKLIDFGATVVSVQTPDRDGQSGDIVLAYKEMATYGKNPSYFGCTVGRFANRIGNGKFTIDGNEYTLTTNDGPKKQHLLHGGKEGFSHRLWGAEKVESKEAVGVKFTLTSTDGDQGFPGEVTAHVTYSLTNNNELRVEYLATTTKPTHVNLTNHCYWNLAGGGDVLKHEVLLYADEMLPVDADLIPTGKTQNVKGTPWDFTTATTIGKRIADETLGKAGAVGRGYDHCYVIRKGNADKSTGLTLAAEVYDPQSGRELKVFTDQPGIQFYSGNFLDGSANSGSAKQHGAFCLECQLYPDSPNQKSFPSSLLNPGEFYKQVTVHQFSVRK